MSGDETEANPLRWAWSGLKARHIELHSSAGCEWVKEQLESAIQQPSTGRSLKAYFISGSNSLVGAVSQGGFVAYMEASSDRTSTGALRATVRGEFASDGHECRCDCRLTTTVGALVAPAAFFALISLVLVGIGAWIVVADHPHSLGYTLLVVGFAFLALISGLFFLEAQAGLRNERLLVDRLQELIR